MNIVDVLILLFVFISAARGLRAGLLRQVFSFAGFWTGFYIGSKVAVGMVSGPGAHPLYALLLILGIAFLGSALGERIGYQLAKIVAKIRFTWLDSLLGAVLGGLTALVAVWLFAALLAAPVFGLRPLLRQSAIITYLNRALPPPPSVIASLEQRFAPGIFPKVFIGLDPSPAPPVEVPVPAEVAQAVTTDKTSVVRIEALACTAINEGSGFVAAPGYVMTNAHVLAGATEPVVYDSKGAHSATTVVFDPDLDIAILRVSGLAGSPLPFVSQDVDRGTKGAVLGYPGGGSFTAVSAGVLQKLHAIGRNIYNDGVSTRDVYEVQAQVEPGNSGGPLVEISGEVMGVVFARSQDTANIGYALTASEVQPYLDQARQARGAVSTDRCLSE